MYAFVHENKAIGPDGPIADVEGTPLEAKDSAAYNAAVESQEIESIKAGVDKIFLYVGHKPESERQDICRMVKSYYCIQTWLGTFLGWAWIGPKRVTGFQGHYRRGSYRRAVTVRMFGVLYHGWYYESSGDYCRLRKAKRQDTKYAASSYLE